MLTIAQGGIWKTGELVKSGYCDLATASAAVDIRGSMNIHLIPPVL